MYLYLIRYMYTWKTGLYRLSVTCTYSSNTNISLPQNTLCQFTTSFPCVQVQFYISCKCWVSSFWILCDEEAFVAQWLSVLTVDPLLATGLSRPSDNVRSAFRKSVHLFQELGFPCYNYWFVQLQWNILEVVINPKQNKSKLIGVYITSNLMSFIITEDNGYLIFETDIYSRPFESQ